MTRATVATRVVDAAIGPRLGIDVVDTSRLRRAPGSRRLMGDAERALTAAALVPPAAVWCVKEAAVKANGGRTSPWSLGDFTVTSLTAGPRADAPPALGALGGALASLVGGAEAGTATVSGPGDVRTFWCTWTASERTVAAVALDARWLGKEERHG